MGGVRLGSCVAGRSPRPRQPMLDPRQQSHRHPGQPRPSSFWIAISATAHRTSGIRRGPRRSARRGRGPPVKRSYGWPENARFLVPDGRHRDHARADTLGDHQTREYQDSVLPPHVNPASPWSRLPPWDGSATSAGRAASSVCTPSAPRRRSRNSRKSSALKRTASWQSRRNCWPGISTCPVFIKNGQGRMRTEGAAPSPRSQEQEDFSFAPSAGLNRWKILCVIKNLGLPIASNREVFRRTGRNFPPEQGQISPNYGDQGENREPARRSRAPSCVLACGEMYQVIALMGAHE